MLNNHNHFSVQAMRATAVLRVIHVARVYVHFRCRGSEISSQRQPADRSRQCEKCGLARQRFPGLAGSLPMSILNPGTATARIDTGCVARSTTNELSRGTHNTRSSL